MNSQELMLGDWIRFSSEPGNFEEALHGKPVRVEGLRDEDGAIKVYERDTYYWSEDEDDFEPIPLTPEILEESGFGYVLKDALMHFAHYYPGEPYFCRCVDTHIGTNGKSFWLNCGENSIYGIHYVHELQHALRLCGIEKEIEL